MSGDQTLPPGVATTWAEPRDARAFYQEHVLAVARAALAGGGAAPLRFPAGQPAVLSPADAAALVDFARAVVDGVLALPAPGGAT